MMTNLPITDLVVRLSPDDDFRKEIGVTKRNLDVLSVLRGSLYINTLGQNFSFFFFFSGGNLF